MINVDGEITPENPHFTNRAFKYGDALFETLKVVASKIQFWEDHYLRLMASMRILRMEIPMHFTMEFLEAEILKTIAENNFTTAAVRVRCTVYRSGTGYYLPKSRTISYVIEVKEIEAANYSLNEEDYVIELFKDYYINSGLLETLKTNNRIVNIVGSIYAAENEYQNCLLLNQDKNVVEALNGNVFIVHENRITTPPLSEGCIHGIVRKQLIAILSEIPDYEFTTSPISPFELQKADEIFITNTIIGIRPVTRYRKKIYHNNVSKALIEALNAKTK